MSTKIRSGTPISARLVLLVSVAGLACMGLAGASHTLTHVSIATQLTEVQRGSFDGRDYISLHIGGHAVGPAKCRNNILRMSTGSDTSAKRQEEIEAIALAAMLAADTVMITVPLDDTQCVDGKPTFTDLYLLPASP